MITEDYVSFESAKLLKEKGFDWDCEYMYSVNEKWFVYCKCNNSSKTMADENYAAPTLQMAMRWLREICNIIIVVSPQILTFKGSESFAGNNWVFDLWENGNPIIGQFYGNQTAYPTYEEACDAAIKCGLENLILI